MPDMIENVAGQELSVWELCLEGGTAGSDINIRVHRTRNRDKESLKRRFIVYAADTRLYT